VGQILWQVLTKTHELAGSVRIFSFASVTHKHIYAVFLSRQDVHATGGKGEGGAGSLLESQVSKFLPLVTDIYTSKKRHFLENQGWFYKGEIQVYFLREEETSAFFLTRPLSCETTVL
jgi:hypothetical protein